MKDPQNVLLACSLIATEVLEYLKTSVSFPDHADEAEERLHGERRPLMARHRVSRLRSRCPTHKEWFKISLPPFSLAHKSSRISFVS